MRDEVVMGVDVGTTRVKAGVLTAAGAELYGVAAPTPWRLSADGPQADPVELGDVAVRVAATAARRAMEDGRHVSALAVTGMAETGVLLDRQGRPLAPAYAWHHTLGDPTRVVEALGRGHFIEVTGRDCTISPSIVKLDMLRTQGHRFARGQRWLNVPDYVAWRLSGVQAAEISTATRTGLVDVPARAWWDEALEFLGAGRWLVAGDLVPGGIALGPTSPDGPPALRGVTVATGGHDHPVAALGAGATEPASLAFSLGTAEAQVRIVTPPVSTRDIRRIVEYGGTVDWHPLGDRLTVLGAVPAGITLMRLAQMLGCAGDADRRALSEAALDVQPPTSLRLSDVTFDSFSLRGIGDGLSPAALWRCAVDSVVELSGDLTERITMVLGPHARPVAFGGWLTDPLVARARRRQLGPTAVFCDLAEPGIVGAAVLAARAVGMPISAPGSVHTTGTDAGEGVSTQRNQDRPGTARHQLHSTENRETHT